MATLENITPAILKQVEENLESKLHDILGSKNDIGGPKVVANMLNLTGSSVERSVLEQLDAHDPEIAENVRNMMFLFEDIQLLADRDVQCLLAEIDQKDLVIALKTASEELITGNKLLKNLSEELQKKWSSQGNIADFSKLIEFVEDVESEALLRRQNLKKSYGITEATIEDISKATKLREVGLAYVFATVL